MQRRNTEPPTMEIDSPELAYLRVAETSHRRRAENVIPWKSNKRHAENGK
jgi:hypothetical protein